MIPAGLTISPARTIAVGAAGVAARFGSWPAKNPSDTKIDYWIDCSAQLLGGATIAQVNVQQSGNLPVLPTIVSSGWDATTYCAVLSGGSDGDIAKFSLQLVRSDNSSFLFEVALPIRGNVPGLVVNAGNLAAFQIGETGVVDVNSLPVHTAPWAPTEFVVVVQPSGDPNVPAALSIAHPGNGAGDIVAGNDPRLAVSNGFAEDLLAYEASVSQSFSTFGSLVSSQGLALTTLGTTVTSLGTSLTTLGTAVSNQGSTVASQTTSLTSLGTTVTSLGSTVASHTTSLTSLGTTVTSLGSTVASHTTSLTSLGTTASSQGSLVSAMQTTVSNLGSTVANQGSVVAAQTTSIAALTASESSQGTSLTALGTTVSNQGSIVASQTTSLTSLGTSVTALSTTVSNLGSTAASQTTSLTSLGATVSSEGSLVAALQTTISNLGSTVASQTASINALTVAIANIGPTAVAAVIAQAQANGQAVPSTTGQIYMADNLLAIS